MRKIFIILLLLFFSNTAMAINNAIKMGYNFVTVSQTVVFNSAMQSGGTLTLSSASIQGWRWYENPGDPSNIKDWYSTTAAMQIINTTQTAYTLTLGAASGHIFSHCHQLWR
jgi:hypothetical protein